MRLDSAPAVDEDGRMKRTGALFHSIVVVGAALGAGASAGCGADERIPPRPDGAPDSAVQIVDARPDAPAADASGDAATPDAMVVIL